jgi:hypothetical protein
MDDWERICGVLSSIFEVNRPLNFDIQLDPEQVATYLNNKVLFIRLNSVVPNEIEAALFVTVDGECGFIASKASASTYKFLVNEFRAFVVQLPEELKPLLWARVQKDNVIVHKLLDRLQFSLNKTTDNALYYTYKGG